MGEKKIYNESTARLEHIFALAVLRGAVRPRYTRASMRMRVWLHCFSAGYAVGPLYSEEMSSEETESNEKQQNAKH